MKTNSYTHTPTLHPSPLISSLQLLMWLFLHPSAWANYITGMAADLRPNFTLVELTPAHWRLRPIRQLLVTVYLRWPLLSGLVIATILWALGEPLANILFGTFFGLSLGLASGLISGATLSVAAGLGSIAVAGIGLGVGAGLVGILLEVRSNAVPLGASTIEQTLLTGALGFLAIGIVGNIAATSATSQTTAAPLDANHYSWTQRIGGFVVGILVSVGVVLIAVAAAYGLAHLLANPEMFASLYGLLGGIALGVVFGGTIGWRTQRWRLGLLLGIGVALLVWLLRVGIDVVMTRLLLTASATQFGLLRSIDGALLGPLLGILFSIVIALPFVLVERIAGPWAGVMAGALGGGGAIVAFALRLSPLTHWPILPLSLLCILFGLGVSLWLPVLLYPFWAAWGAVLFWLDRQQTNPAPLRLPAHPAFWDEHQRLPWPNLAEYVVLAMARNPQEGERALAFLHQSPQRWAAQAAQVELDARLLEQSMTVDAIRLAGRQVAAGELTSPAGSLLRSFSRIGLDIDAALAQESSYNQRLALVAVEERLDNLLRELTRSDEAYATRFYPIANQWRQIVHTHVDSLAAAVELRQEIDSPYVIGIPLTAQQEIFVGRTEISARIEQLLLDRRHPPLLLYGQRRMGKTSLLNNLSRLLPSTIVPFFVDMQGPVSLASDYTGFLYNLARSMAESARRQRNLAIPTLTRAELASDPFTYFDEWIEKVEKALGDCTGLLALDEFEVLDNAIATGRFSEEAILGTLRHLIQHHTRFKVLLTGSHVLEELKHWATYLINVQVVHIGYLKPEETRQLVEQPVKDFALRYEKAASQRVLALTRGHPALTQLVCYEIVALKNQQDPRVRRLATLADVEAVIAAVLEHGSLFFSEIENGQLDPPSARLLRFLAAQGEGAQVTQAALVQHAPEHAERAIKLLLQRELIERVNDGYRFQVELIRRWFVEPLATDQ